MLSSNRSFDFQHRLDDQPVTPLHSEPRKLKVDLTLQMKSLKMRASTDYSKDVDLIDFKDDGTRTPQLLLEVDKEKQIADYQLKMLEEFLVSTGNSKAQLKSTLSPEQEVEFQKFFDKYESNIKQHNKNTQNKEVRIEVAGSSKLNIDGAIGDPKVLIPNLKGIDREKNHFKVGKDFTEEILDKNPKIQLRHNSTYQLINNSVCHEKMTTNNIFSQPNSHQFEKESNTFHNGIMNEIVANNNIQYAAMQPYKNPFGIPFPKDEKGSDNSNYYKSLPTTNIDGNHKDTSSKIIDLVTKHDIRYLEAKKKDENLFKKSSLLITEYEKLNLTPGPTLFEKSVALPQMIKRLNERKQVSENLDNVTRKLILDTDHTYCKAAEREVDVTKHCQRKNIDRDKPSLADKTQIQNVSSASPILQKINTISDSKEKCVSYPAVESLIKLRRDLMNLSEPGTSNNSGASKSPLVLNPPVVLADNCNKQRYIAYATSRLFEDFIRSGK